MAVCRTHNKESNICSELICAWCYTLHVRMSQFLSFYKSKETEPGFKFCKSCPAKIKFNDLKSHGTSLKAHITNKHPEFLVTESGSAAKVPKITEFYTEKSGDFPVLPKLDRVAIALCCSSHVLPFDIVEDNIFKWGFDFCGYSRKKIAERVTMLQPINYR